MERLKKQKVLRFRCTDEEYNSVVKKAVGFRCMSDFLRELVLNTKKVIVEPNAFFNSVDVLSKEINRIGININQTAKYINYAEKNGIVSNEILEALRNDFREQNLKLEEVNKSVYELMKFQL